MEEFKCPVCKSQYTQLNPPRLLTMCGHTFCHQCIKIFIKRKQYRYQVRCPEDKLRISIDTPTPTQFPKNMIVIEAMNKLKPKVERNQQKNEFLSGVFTQNMSTCHKNSLVASTKQSLLVSRRSSTDDGRCLIHQKPLDIICLQQKTNICAQCALFGVHKGHVCTTIKDLQLKRREWIHQIAQIMQQKKYLQQKMKQNTLFNSLNTLLEKKRQDLIAQVQQYFQHLQKSIQGQQKEMTTLIEQSLSMNENKLAKNVFVSEIREDRFQNWQKQVLDSMQYLQTDDIAKEITFFSNMVLLKDENLITKGRNIIKQMKQQKQKYWTHVEASLLYPVIKYNQKFQQQIKNVVELIDSSQSQKIPSRRTSFDDTIIHGIITPQFQQISLLDFTDHFKFENNMSTFNDSRNESRILTDNSFLPNLDTSSDFDISPKTIKKEKSKELLTNTSLCKTNDKRDSFNSPKYRKNSEFTSKGTLPPSSPVFMKNKSKNTNFLKVKDPQKYLKIMKALETDSLQIVDFTGFEMGDQNAKQVFQKLKYCKKVKSVRLMKNQLTDDILKEVLEVVPELQIINLSQNAFTSKAFEVLLQIAKKDRPNKVRYIQLGQNNINPRKYRQKLQQLRQLGYVVSL